MEGHFKKKKKKQKNRWIQAWSFLMLLEWPGRSSRSWLTMANLGLLQTAKLKEKFLKVLLQLHYHPKISKSVKIHICASSSFGLSRRGFKSVKCATVKGLGADRLGDIHCCCEQHFERYSCPRQRMIWISEEELAMYLRIMPMLDSFGNSKLLPVYSKEARQKHVSLSGLLYQTCIHGIWTFQMLSSKDIYLFSLYTPFVSVPSLLLS